MVGGSQEKQKNSIHLTQKITNFFFNELNFNNIKKKLVKSSQNVNLEIGFGKGENLIFQSQIKKKRYFSCN